MKRDRIASLGATVHVVDGLYDDAQAAATEHQAQTGALAVHPFDHVDVVAGQGTMARELEQQVAALGTDFDTVLVATGRRRVHRRSGRVVRRPQAGGQRRAETSQCSARGTPGRRAGGRSSVAGVAADSLGARRWATSRGASCATTSPSR
jgi:threonine dehydratase